MYVVAITVSLNRIATALVNEQTGKSYADLAFQVRQRSEALSSQRSTLQGTSSDLNRAL
jgi:hypothetical protein